MGLDLTGLGSLFELGSKILDKAIPDQSQREAAKLELFKAQQAGQLDEIKVNLSAILAEAQSPDKWTSRARPTFMYVVYTLLLWSLPMGVLYMFAPEKAAEFTVGFKGWLDAIPEHILTLFGTVMLGYTAGRSWEKVKGAAK